MVKKVIEIRGQKYYVKKYDSGADTLTLIAVDDKTLLNSEQTQDMLDSALLVPGTDIKIGLQNLNVSDGSADFAIIEGGVVTSYKHRDAGTSAAFLVGEDQELLSNYYIIVTFIDPAGNYINLAIGKKSDEFKIADGDTNVLGYAEAALGQTGEWAGAGASTELCRLDNAEMTLAKDSSAQVENTNAWVKYNKDKYFDIETKKTKTSVSGTKLKANKTPWDDFLTMDVTVSAVGGTCEALNLDVIDDTAVTSSDKSGYNLFAFGGDMANALSADAVTSGLSTAPWASLAPGVGTIEVIPDAFASGKYLIIGAGSERTGTQAAADSAAAMV